MLLDVKIVLSISAVISFLGFTVLSMKQVYMSIFVIEDPDRKTFEDTFNKYVLICTSIIPALFPRKFLLRPFSKVLHGIPWNTPEAKSAMLFTIWVYITPFSYGVFNHIFSIDCLWLLFLVLFCGLAHLELPQIWLPEESSLPLTNSVPATKVIDNNRNNCVKCVTQMHKNNHLKPLTATNPMVDKTFVQLIWFDAILLLIHVLYYCERNGMEWFGIKKHDDLSVKFGW